jgi:WD40 repeat protein
MENSAGLDDLFLRASRLPRPERTAFVDGCSPNAQVRNRLKDLLDAHDEAPDFLESPAVRAPTLELATQSPVVEGPGVTVGRYKLLDLIGEGGFGAVYLADQKEPVRRKVALKIIKLGMDTKQVIARFEAERQALAMMDHPSIAKVLDAGATDTGRPYFVMEYVKGVPINEFCDRENLTTKERLALFVTVCNAVQHAHQRGIIHRDLKPTNVLVTVHDDHPVPKVIDFGIAKATSHELTERTLFTGLKQFIGTPEYMSPEQAQMSGVDVDTRSDVYALGVLLYELLTGTTPFDAGELRKAGMNELQRIIREEEPPKPSTRVSVLNGDIAGIARHRRDEPSHLARSLRGDLDWIVMRALEKDRARRYDTAREFARDIERHLANEAVSAGPPNAAYKLRKFIRRHHVAVTAGALTMAALVLGSVLAAIGFVQATGQRNQAEQARNMALGAMERATQQRDRAEEARVAEAQQRELAIRQRDLAIAAEQEAQRQAYVANVYAADASLRFNEVFEAKRRLSACKPELRGWEWWHLQCQVDDSALQLQGHEKKAFAVAISPDGSRFIGGSWDKTIRMWESATGELLATFRGHEAEVMAVAFSPDGRRIVSGSSNSVIRVWDVDSGENLLTLRGHTAGWIPSVQYSPDGARIVSGGSDAEIRLWDAGTGEELRVIDGHGELVRAVVFSPDGTTLVSASLDGTIRTWDATNGDALATIARYEELKTFIAMAVSPDGRRVYAAGGDGKIRIWDAATGDALGAIDGYDTFFAALAISSDGSRLAASGKYGIQVWDTESLEQLGTLVGHEGWISSLAISPDGRTALSAADDGSVRTWSVTPTDWPSIQVRHPSRVDSVAISPDGTRIASAGRDKTVRIWSADTGVLVHTLDELDRRARSVAFSSDGTRLATVSGDGTVRIWDPATGTPVDVLEVDQGHYFVTYNHDGSRLATGGHDIWIWDATTGKSILEINPAGDWVGHLSFSPDGTRIVSASGSERPAPDWDTVEVWDAASGKPIASWRAMGMWGAMVFSADGTKVFGGDEKQICAWDPATGEKLIELPGVNAYSPRIAVFADGRRFVTAGISVRIWDPEYGESLLTLRGHEHAISSVAVSANGRRIVSSDTDGSVRIWDTPPH